MRNLLRSITLPVLATVAVSASADGPLEDKVLAALAGDVRTEADRARDRNRKPLDTLEFFEITPDMRVLELLPGGGWYTKILGPVLADDGQLFVALGTSRVQQSLLDQPGFSKVEVLDVDAELERDGPFRTYNISTFSFPEDDMDAVLTFRNLHNFTSRARQRMHKAAFDALKPGGIYGVVDHTARHMEPMTNENRRRLDPVIAIKEIVDAGFVFEAYSDLHYKPDDELRYEVGRKSVTGNTDRFTLRFRKPD